MNIENIKRNLESEEFYNLMQIYRHTPISNQKEVTKAFEEVKAFIISCK